MERKAGRPKGKRGWRRETAGPRSGPAAAVREDSPEGVRLNRFIAQAGVASRRKADELIADGRVKVNDQVVTDFSTRIRTTDKVEVGGRVVSSQDLVYILLNKPSDTITTRQDEKGRRTVMDLVDIDEAKKGSVYPVGRLDRDTVGALLLTNDGELAHRLMHPRYNVEKIYKVRTREPVKPHQIDELKKGVELEDGPAKADRVAYVAPPDHHELAILLHEGRNRQIRRMMEALGHEVVSLERVSYAGLDTEGVRRGRWRRLEPHEIHHLRSLVKLR